MNKPATIPDIQKQLEIISQELMTLIQKYELDAENPLDVIPVARKKITETKDYTRFLELSLEGRLLGEAAEHIHTNNETLQS
ncbi:hypothetical protein [Kiloniella antarctica]|uniref:Uncharacterized protein n=1 Tax=Kiloniella antarctica TaxID=1550907 RepID=A0ABW5BRW8_9PROT